MRVLLITTLFLILTSCSTGRRAPYYFYYIKDNPQQELIKNYVHMVIVPRCHEKYQGSVQLDSCIRVEMRNLFLGLEPTNGPRMVKRKTTYEDFK